MSKTVEEVGRMSFTGNIIPANWLKTLRHDSGKPNMVAIMVLSEIVYWYRPMEIRDESTGELQKPQKKFKADKLQRSYQSFADQFGFSKRQVKESMDFLEKTGVITREFRTITEAGTVLNNVLYIDINVEMLKAVTYQTEESPSPECTTLPHSNVPPSHVSLSPSPTFERGTNTEITTETTTKSKREEEEDDPFRFYQENIMLNIKPFVAEEISYWIDSGKFDKPNTVIVEAMKIAVRKEAVKNKWDYANKLLMDWSDKGLRTIEVIRNEIQDMSKTYSSRKKASKQASTFDAIESMKQRIKNGEFDKDDA
ncbi:DnaD/phage-associated family protein [Aneurinibacillus soli]|uniref:Replication initiation and membrane attachment n=1 Tax=Aneurinibacillus soli TaxID=1500254 RepID=A0A0U5AWT5_9BACL|nr:DnaD domain protein [Aneurinibacillus soli]PYE64248.1 DnaD/phage-associated family protein [Aneurinibacillus soli]BAU28197.1 Replication initiation and membrane attachment [Aneurinibacillus soli]